MLARALASPAQGFHRHGPRHNSSSYFCMMYGVEKIRIVDKTYWSVVSPVCCWERWPWVGTNNLSRLGLHSIRGVQ